MKFYGWDSREISVEQWMELVETTDRHVGETIVPKIGGAYRVSTVLLGLDHGFTEGRLRIFETMIFPDCLMVARYATLQAARKGHNRTVRALRRARLGLPVLIHKGGKP
jgi:hypothetical protein